MWFSNKIFLILAVSSLMVSLSCSNPFTGIAGTGGTAGDTSVSQPNPALVSIVNKLVEDKIDPARVDKELDKQVKIFSDPHQAMASFGREFSPDEIIKIESLAKELIADVQDMQKNNTLGGVLLGTSHPPKVAKALSDIIDIVFPENPPAPKILSGTDGRPPETTVFSGGDLAKIKTLLTPVKQVRKMFGQSTDSCGKSLIERVSDLEGKLITISTANDDIKKDLCL